MPKKKKKEMSALDRFTNEYPITFFYLFVVGLAFLIGLVIFLFTGFEIAGFSEENPYFMPILYIIGLVIIFITENLGKRYIAGL